MRYDPYRILGTNYIDLKPVYDWRETKTGPRPMLDWFGAEYSFTVLQVWTNRLLLLDFWNTNRPERFKFALTNYPDHAHAVDGQTINFIAKQTGRYQWRDFVGTVHTVPLYDYGIPYDPWLLKRERERQQNANTNPAPRKPVEK